ncbi:hypothetical protein M378DRAFT_182118 [Amanita muscaria Koide BX008]|uniref:Ribonuclease H1 N-terminal domain-containing protein n=1 Tax=Amanita muscaria (strain Koide BX008) TaxID=946122 RepID=A0A0C2WGU4_AMAMK|nr:hypothetical protein M378DRAFT_182118 [Amanita muscaria Koide BX008]
MSQREYPRLDSAHPALLTCIQDTPRSARGPPPIPYHTHPLRGRDATVTPTAVAPGSSAVSGPCRLGVKSNFPSRVSVTGSQSINLDEGLHRRQPSPDDYDYDSLPEEEFLPPQFRMVVKDSFSVCGYSADSGNSDAMFSANRKLTVDVALGGTNNLIGNTDGLVPTSSGKFSSDRRNRKSPSCNPGTQAALVPQVFHTPVAVAPQRDFTTTLPASMAQLTLAAPTPTPARSYVSVSSSPRKKKNLSYVVSVGRCTGVFDSWSEVKDLVTGINATHESFTSKEEASIIYQKLKAKGRVRIVRHTGDEVKFSLGPIEEAIQ